MKLRTVIVDDEHIARQRLRRLLAREAEIEIIAECGNAAEALAAVEEDSPDLLLLDIQMPGANGFDVVERLDTARRPAVVFVTGFDRHAVHAFETWRDRLSAQTGRGCKRPRSKRLLVSALVCSKARRKPRRHGKWLVGTSVAFLSAAEAQTAFIAPNEIDWIEACGNYAILHVGPRNHFLRKTVCRRSKRCFRRAISCASVAQLFSISIE